MSDLEGQRVLVTGAAGGLGSAVSARLKSLGVDVVGLDRVAGVDVRVDVSSATEVRAAIALLRGYPAADRRALCGDNSDDQFRRHFAR